MVKVPCTILNILHPYRDHVQQPFEPFKNLLVPNGGNGGIPLTTRKHHPIPPAATFSATKTMPFEKHGESLDAKKKQLLIVHNLRIAQD